HSSTQVAAHRPSEQSGVSFGHGLDAPHSKQAPLACLSQFFVAPSPAQATSPSVHHAPHGRCASVSRRSVFCCDAARASAFPYAILAPPCMPHTERANGRPAVASSSVTSTVVPVVSAAGSLGTVVSWSPESNRS